MGIRKHILECGEPAQIIAENEGRYFVKKFYFPKDFIGFQGHFPQFPTLPGIVQIIMAELTISEVLQKKYSLKSVKQAKYSAPLSPEEEIFVEARHKDKNVWDCLVKTHEKQAAQIRMELVEENQELSA